MIISNLQKKKKLKRWKEILAHLFILNDMSTLHPSSALSVYHDTKLKWVPRSSWPEVKGEGGNSAHCPCQYTKHLGQLAGLREEEGACQQFHPILKTLMNIKKLLSKIFEFLSTVYKDFPGGSNGKESACNARDLGLIPGSGRPPGEGNGYPLQYSSWKIPWTEKPGRLPKRRTRLSD